MAELFTSGSSEAVRKLNLLVADIRALQNLTGDVFIRTNVSPLGTTVRLNFGAILDRIMKNRSEERSPRRAFVKTTPGATTTLVCFLDVDTTGTQVDVECTIYGEGNLDEAHPAFVDGDPLWVAYNAVDGEWQNVTRIDGAEVCVNA